MESTGNNLLIVAVDSLRAKGLDAGVAPQLARLASEGMHFTRAYAPAPWGPASVAGLLTGEGPELHGIVSLEDSLASGVETLAGRLTSEGYDCRAVVSDFLVGGGRGLDRGFASCSMAAARGPSYVSTDAVTDEAVALLRSRGDEAPPFFLFVHYADPAPALHRYEHTELAAPQAGEAGSAAQLKGGEPLAFLKVLARDATEAERAALLALYEGGVRHTDAGIARLLQALDELGLRGSTVVVALGTHGIELAERGGAGSGHSLHEELVHVPLIFRAPHMPRSRVDLPVSLTSVYPTALSLLGLAPREGLRARSLADYRFEPIVTQVDLEPRDLSGKAHQRAVIDQRYKLIRDEVRGTLQLFDLELDPGELEDVAPLLPDEVERLAALLGSIAARP